MIVIKHVPGLTAQETVEALIDISSREVATGDGGFIVDEEAAYEFLRAYLTIRGKIKEVPPPVQEEVPPPVQEEVPPPGQEDPPLVEYKPRTTRGRRATY